VSSSRSRSDSKRKPSRRSRVLIVDDHAVVRRGIRQILAEASDFDVDGEAATGSAALAILRSRDVDVVVLDLSLPDVEGLDLLVTMRREWPSVPVLVLTIHPEEWFAVPVMKAGAHAFLSKESAPEELLSALRRILAGERIQPKRSSSRFVSDVVAGAHVRHERLSARELDVLRRIADGRTVSQIAVDLLLSVKTVSTYRARLLDKLGLSTTADLIRYALQHGLATGQRI